MKYSLEQQVFVYDNFVKYKFQRTVVTNFHQSFPDFQMIQNLVKKLRNMNNSIMGGSPGELSEDLVTYEKRKKGWRMNCDVGEATEGLENEL